MINYRRNAAVHMPTEWITGLTGYKNNKLNIRFEKINILLWPVLCLHYFKQLIKIT